MDFFRFLFFYLLDNDPKLLKLSDESYDGSSYCFFFFLNKINHYLIFLTSMYSIFSLIIFINWCFWISLCLFFMLLIFFFCFFYQKNFNQNQIVQSYQTYFQYFIFFYLFYLQYFNQNQSFRSYQTYVQYFIFFFSYNG